MGNRGHRPRAQANAINGGETRLVLSSLGTFVRTRWNSWARSVARRSGYLDRMNVDEGGGEENKGNVVAWQGDERTRQVKWSRLELRGREDRNGQSEGKHEARCARGDRLGVTDTPPPPPPPAGRRPPTPPP